MEEQNKYYDEAQKIKIVEVALKELDEAKYTYLMTNDFVALAHELVYFGLDPKFLEEDFRTNPHLSQSVREAMEKTDSTYSVTFSHNVHVLNHYVPGHTPEIINLTPFLYCTETWQPPILTAMAIMDREKQLEYLLSTHFPVDQEDNRGRTALLFAAQKNAINAGRILIKYGASVDIRDSYGITPLISAVSAKSPEFVKLLLDNGAKINRVCFGGSPLSEATSSNSCELVELLLDRGADVNITSQDGSTPLLLAVKYCAEEAACLLVDRGARIHVRNNQGYTPVRLLAQRGLSFLLRKLIDLKLLTQKDMEEALVFATFEGHLSLVKTLIYEKMDVNYQVPEKGVPLLTVATLANRKDVVQFLLERGADVEIRDKMGLRPLDHAERDHRQEIQKMLTNQYKKKNISPQPLEDDLADYQSLLNMYIDRYLEVHKGAKRSDLWKTTLSISKQLFSDITHKAGYKTKKDKLIILAAKLELSVNELNKLLKAAGFSLFPADSEDNQILHAFACGNYAAVEPLFLKVN